VFATELAAALDRLPPDAPDATRTMLARFGLPTAAPDGLAAADLIALMRRDKKAAGGLTFVLPAPGAGSLERVDDPPAAAVERALTAVGVRA
jgi:3-dehydroquinate synthetase